MLLNNEIVLALNVFLNSDGQLPKDVKEVITHAQIAAQSSRFVKVKICYVVDAAQKQEIETKIANLDGQNAVFSTLRHPQKLPMVGDILRSAQAKASDSSYICYINADIILPYWFFDFAAASIKTHRPNTGFIINRKDIINHEASFYDERSRLSIRYHPGFDCFLFPQRVLHVSHFGRCTVGLPPVGALLATNMLIHLDEVRLINDSVITLHRGDGQRESSWVGRHEEIESNFQKSFIGMDKLIRHLKGKNLSEIKTLTHSKGFLMKYLKSRGQ